MLHAYLANRSIALALDLFVNAEFCLLRHWNEIHFATGVPQIISLFTGRQAYPIFVFGDLVPIRAQKWLHREIDRHDRAVGKLRLLH